MRNFVSVPLVWPLVWALTAPFLLPSSTAAGKEKPQPVPLERRTAPFAFLTGDGKLIKLITPPPFTALDHNNRGVELGSKGYWQEALSAHESAVIHEPSNHIYRVNLSGACLRYGDLLRDQNKLIPAIEQYSKACAADPSNAPAKAHMDECVKKLGFMPNLPKLARAYTTPTDAPSLEERVKAAQSARSKAAPKAAPATQAVDSQGGAAAVPGSPVSTGKDSAKDSAQDPPKDSAKDSEKASGASTESKK